MLEKIFTFTTSLIKLLMTNLFKRFVTLTTFLVNLLKIIVNFVLDKGTFLAAITTLILAFFTYDMAKETRRLADINTEQFKIKSYPDFVLEVMEPEYIDKQPPKSISDFLIQKFKISNRGEITAHRVTFLYILIFQKNDTDLVFDVCNSVYYKDLELPAIDYESKIPKMAFQLLTGKYPFTKEYNKDNLKYCLFFMKFKVPYDDKYSYETQGFILDKTFVEKSKIRWQRISTNDHKILTQRYLNADPNRSLLKTFFADYDVSAKKTIQLPPLTDG